MKELVTLYLLIHKQCPLPAIGALQLNSGNAVASPSERKIASPMPSIELISSIRSAGDFINFIAVKKNISESEAEKLLNEFCSKIQKMDSFSETVLPETGKFYVNADGKILFKSIEVPGVFISDVPAVRVIHPESSHAIMVGDRETTSAEMAAFFTETVASAKNNWWISAIVLAVIGIITFVFYFNDPAHSSTFGNSMNLKDIKNASNTYRASEG